MNVAGLRRQSTSARARNGVGASAAHDRRFIAGCGPGVHRCERPGPERLPDTEQLPPPIPNSSRFHLPAPFGLTSPSARPPPSMTASPASTTPSASGAVAATHASHPIACCTTERSSRRGGEIEVDRCLRCRCEPTGPVCERRTDGACPDGSPFRNPESGAYEVVPLGEQRAMSETAVCLCDATAGLTGCRTIYTNCEDGTPEGERVPQLPQHEPLPPRIAQLWP